MKKISFIAFIILIVLNAGSQFLNRIDCSYSNGNGSFTFAEENFKERNFEMCERRFATFRKQNKSDTILYRLCRMKIYQFWNWGQYLFQEKFRLPFRPWEDIRSKRGNLENKSGFQDF